MPQCSMAPSFVTLVKPGTHPWMHTMCQECMSPAQPAAVLLTPSYQEPQKMKQIISSRRTGGYPGYRLSYVVVPNSLQRPSDCMTLCDALWVTRVPCIIAATMIRRPQTTSRK